ncbi:MAG: hypothetical protein R2873_16265 [Caldilineaceae bacterium]
MVTWTGRSRYLARVEKVVEAKERHILPKEQALPGPTSSDTAFDPAVHKLGGSAAVAVCAFGAVPVSGHDGGPQMALDLLQHGADLLFARACAASWLQAADLALGEMKWMQ